MAVQFEKPIALGADHGGYELKEAIKQHLEERGCTPPGTRLCIVSDEFLSCKENLP